MDTMGAQHQAGWFADPLGRNDHRYWDGSDWTEHVSNAGTVSTDPTTALGHSTETVVDSLRPSAVSDFSASAGEAIEAVGAKVAELAKRRSPATMLIAAAVVIVMGIGTLTVGRSLLPSPGNFCGDVKAMAQRYAGLDQYNLTSNDLPEVRRAADDFHHLADEAPDAIKDDMTLVADQMSNAISGHSTVAGRHAADAASARIEVYGSTHCN